MAQCRLREFKQSTYAQQLSKNDFIFWTRKPQKGFLTCVGRQDRLSHFRKELNSVKEGQTLITIPNTCALALGGYVMNAEDMRMNSSYLTKNLSQEYHRELMTRLDDTEFTE